MYVLNQYIFGQSSRPIKKILKFATQMIRSVTYSAPGMAACAVIAVFYAAYFLKMLRQRRKGITTDVMAKGDKPKALRRQEALMKAAPARPAATSRVRNWVRDIQIYCVNLYDFLLN